MRGLQHVVALDLLFIQYPSGWGNLVDLEPFLALTLWRWRFLQSLADFGYCQIYFGKITVKSYIFAILSKIFFFNIAPPKFLQPTWPYRRKRGNLQLARWCVV